MTSWLVLNLNKVNASRPMLTVSHFWLFHYYQYRNHSLTLTNVCLNVTIKECINACIACMLQVLIVRKTNEMLSVIFSDISCKKMCLGRFVHLKLSLLMLIKKQKSCGIMLLSVYSLLQYKNKHDKVEMTQQQCGLWLTFDLFFHRQNHHSNKWKVQDLVVPLPLPLHSFVPFALSVGSKDW